MSRPTTIAEILAVAQDLFGRRPDLDSWQAVEEVLEAIPEEELRRICYADRSYDWCAQAPRLDYDGLIQLCIEKLAVQMRGSHGLRRRDDNRSRGRGPWPSTRRGRRR